MNKCQAADNEYNIIMSYKSFVKTVKENLALYNDYGNGSFNGAGSYPHIVDLNGRDKLEVIREIIRKDGENPDLFRKPHRYAHHLNSSQVVCYEYFRHLMDNKDEMMKNLRIMGLPYDDIAGMKMQFEKEFPDGEGTNFDFFMAYGENRVFVEVKYTEAGFGSCKNDDYHKKKFCEIYQRLIEKSPFIQEEKKMEIGFLQMREFYQLFRNVISAKDETDFVVFLFPRKNSIVLSQFEAFRDKYLSQVGRQNVKEVFWEGLTNCMSDAFRSKFFFYVNE